MQNLENQLNYLKIFSENICLSKYVYLSTYVAVRYLQGISHVNLQYFNKKLDSECTQSVHLIMRVCQPPPNFLTPKNNVSSSLLYSDADVVCGQLGFGPAAATFPSAAFGEGTGPIQLDDVECTGDESKLIDCPASDLGEHNCGHQEDASVMCSVPGEEI